MPDSNDIVIEKGEWLLIQDPDFYCNGIFKGGMNAYIYIYIYMYVCMCVCVCARVHACMRLCMCVCVCDMLNE